MNLGPQIFRVLVFPLLFLLFGVPVLLDGNVIHLPRLSLGVAEACSGIRSLISLFSVAVGYWQTREGALLELDTLNVLKAKDYLMRRDQDPSGRSAWLFIAYWESHRKGAQPHSPRNCLPGGGWEPLEASRVTIPLPPPLAPISVNRFLIQ